MKKSLLFIIEHLNAGGAERSLVDVLTHLNYSKYDVDLLLLQGKGDYEKEIPYEVNILLYSLNNAFGPMKTCLKDSIKNRDWFSFWFRLVYFFSSHTSWRNLKFARGLFKELKDEYDCVVACRQSNINELAAFTFKGKKKFSWWHHGVFDVDSKRLKRLNDAYSCIDYIVAVSKSSAEIVRKGFNVSPHKVVIIPNMLCIDRIVNKSHEYQCEMNSKMLNIVSAGRFSPEKNMGLCVKIGAVLKRKGIDYKWYMIGDGEEEDYIKKSTQEYGLEKEFVFTGRLNNPYPYMLTADLFVHPSIVESQGLAVLESMALKTPVIVVESEGPKEYIVNGENGFLVYNDATQIGELINRIYCKKDLLSNISTKAYKTVQKYSPQNTMALIEELLFDSRKEDEF